MSDQNSDQKKCKKHQSARQLLTAMSKRQRGHSKLERLSADRLKSALEIIRLGVYDYVAAQSVGVSRGTWIKWMRAGEEAVEQEEYSNVYAMFYLAVEEARSAPRILAEASVMQGSPLVWLKSVAPKEWSETHRLKVEAQHDVDVSGNMGFNIIPPNTVAEGLEYLQELGYIEQTELGAKLLPDKSKVENEEILDVDSTDVSGNGNGKPRKQSKE